MSMKRTWPISSPISFLTSVDTVNYLATCPVQREKYIRRDFYKLDWMASRAIHATSPKKCKAQFNNQNRARGRGGNLVPFAGMEIDSLAGGVDHQVALTNACVILFICRVVGNWLSHCHGVAEDLIYSAPISFPETYPRVSLPSETTKISATRSRVVKKSTGFMAHSTLT